MESGTVKKIEVLEIPVEDLIPTSQNSRFLVDKEKDESLKQSIKEHGIQQPLLARMHPKELGKYDLRAGFRRLKAARELGMKTVPVIVRQMDDKLALEVTIIENLQRENLHPLEECRGIRLLLETDDMTIEEVARKLGKTPKWVARRMQLDKLSPKWEKAIMEGDKEGRGIQHLPVAIYEMVAALPAKLQDVALKDVSPYKISNDGPIPKPHDFAEWLSANFTMRLQDAPFKKDEDNPLDKVGPCTTCPKRSGVQPLLWDGHEDCGPAKIGKNEVCLDPECFTRKAMYGVFRKYETAKEEYGDKVLLITDAGYNASEIEEKIKDAADKGKIPTISRYDFNNRKKKDKGAVPAIVGAGPGLGTLKWITRYGTGGSYSGSSKREKGTSTPLKERRENLKRKREIEVVSRVIVSLNDDKAVYEALPEDKKRHRYILCLAAAFGVSGNGPSSSDHVWNEFEEYKGYTLNVQQLRVFSGILDKLDACLKSINPYYPGSHYKAAEKICEALSINFKAIVAKVEEDKPEPKSWKNLKADGTPKAKKQKTSRKGTKNAK